APPRAGSAFRFPPRFPCLFPPAPRLVPVALVYALVFGPAAAVLCPLLALPGQAVKASREIGGLMVKRRRKQSPSAARSSESRTAEALTVGWLLAVMMTGLCELGSVIALALHGLGSETAPAAAYLFFAALVVGAA